MLNQILLGATLENMWTSIRNRCAYAFKKPERATDQDELLKFMRKTIQRKNRPVSNLPLPIFVQGKMSKVTIPQQNAKQLEPEQEDNSEDDGVWQNSNSEPETEPKSKENEEESQDKDKELKEKLKSQKLESCRTILSQSFNELNLDKAQQMKIMMAVCNKIFEFKNSRGIY